MFAVALSALLAFTPISFVAAQETDPSATFPLTPLTDKHYAYPTGIPYQVDQDDLIRGTQSGYNICNSTTEGPESECQTMFLNNLASFCLWSSPVPNGTIGEEEALVVAYCSQPGYGTRLMPPGTIQGAQFLIAPDYIEVVGFINQVNLDLNPSDYGGELDPHGADLRGNPLGALVYSNFWSNNNNSYEQVIEWNLFIGSDTFCFKACNPNSNTTNNYCQNIYDEIGCNYNMPNNAQNGSFVSCYSDDQAPAGIYSIDGVTYTYSQPADGPITTMPYTPVVPASSDCTTYQSTDLYAALLTAFPSSSTPAPTGTGTAGSSPTEPGSGTTSRAGSAPGATSTSSSGALATVALSAMTFAGILASLALLS